MDEELNDSNFAKKVLESAEPVLVDFWAPWCGPCRTISPVVEKLAREYKGKVNVFKLNTDDNPNSAATYRVQSIPTLLFFKAGKIVEQLVGAQHENEIRKRLDNLLK